MCNARHRTADCRRLFDILCRKHIHTTHIHHLSNPERTITRAKVCVLCTVYATDVSNI